MKRFNLKALLFISYLLLASTAKLYSAGGEAEPIKVDWSFKWLIRKRFEKKDWSKNWSK